MGFLADLVTKAQDLLADAHRPPTLTEAVTRNYYDRLDWQTIRDTVPAIQQEVNELAQTVDHVEDFMGDLHATFFKIDPQLHHAEEMLPTYVANREVIEQMLEMPEVQALRQHSAGDMYGSALAMVAMKEVVGKTLRQAQQAAAERAEQQQSAQEQADQLGQAMLDWTQRLAEEGDDENGTGAGKLEALIDQFADNQTAQQQAAEQVRQAAENACNGMSNAMRWAAKKATEDLDGEQELASAFGMDPGVMQRIPVRERLALAAKLRGSRLAEFAKLLGQFKMVQQAESRKRVTNASSEVHGITVGDELTRMVAGEYLNYADESLQTLMLARWAEDQLNIYDVRGKENLGQGPIIVVCDESGSMSARDVAGGTREAWSKALSLALCDQARRRKRDFTYIGFASYGQQRVVEFPAGEARLENVIEMTEGFLNGGTSYEKPLTLALQMIEEKFDNLGKARPDVVFITDDEYGQLKPAFLAEWNRVKDKASIKCYGISLGCGYSGALEALSDNVRSVRDLLTSDPRQLGDLFRTI
jgi:uncharacterized protein with von Willebrand factor type A (vWA) domain